jgi:alpha-1,3-fucosyltransferase
MNHNIVPVVYRGANYSQLAPHHSYINALDLTPEKLAQYLMLLDANDMFYNEYFWWKDHYRVESARSGANGETRFLRSVQETSPG